MQASVSNNQTVKISAAVSNSRNSNGTIYTCPANSYAILNVLILSPADSVSVGGVSTFVATTGSDRATIYVGPAQTVVSNHGASNLVTVSGVEFTNSP